MKREMLSFVDSIFTLIRSTAKKKMPAINSKLISGLKKKKNTLTRPYYCTDGMSKIDLILNLPCQLLLQVTAISTVFSVFFSLFLFVFVFFNQSFIS